MPLFLFNVHDRKLHGIFRAVTDGDWEINPSGKVETQPSAVRGLGTGAPKHPMTRMLKVLCYS